MAIIDRLNNFSTGGSVAAAAGTYVLGDVIDLGDTSNFPADGEPMFLTIECTAQMTTGGTAGTIQFFLVSDSSSGLGSATLGNCTEHARSLAIVTDDTAAIAAGIEAGTATYLPNIAPTTAQTGITDPNKVVNRPPILQLALPYGVYERYLGILYTVGTTTTDGGTVNAYLTKDGVQRWRGYPNAI